jgi:hypothetical protein
LITTKRIASRHFRGFVSRREKNVRMGRIRIRPHHHCYTGSERWKSFAESARTVAGASIEHTFLMEVLQER